MSWKIQQIFSYLSWFAFLYPFMLDIPALRKELEQLCECFKLKASSAWAEPLPWLLPLELFTVVFLFFLNVENNFCHLDWGPLDACVLLDVVGVVVVEGGIEILTHFGDSEWYLWSVGRLCDRDWCEEEYLDWIPWTWFEEGSPDLAVIGFLLG